MREQVTPSRSIGRTMCQRCPTVAIPEESMNALCPTIATYGVRRSGHLLLLPAQLQFLPQNSRPLSILVLTERVTLSRSGALQDKDLRASAGRELHSAAAEVCNRSRSE